MGLNKLISVTLCRPKGDKKTLCEAKTLYIYIMLLRYNIGRNTIMLYKKKAVSMQEQPFLFSFSVGIL
jgi:hypothetical protein